MSNVVNICTREKYFLPGEDNYLLIHNDEKVALNPVFVARVIALYQTLVQSDPDVQLAARTPEIAAILIAGRIPNWITKYGYSATLSAIKGNDVAGVENA